MSEIPLHQSIAYIEAAMVLVSDRAITHYLCHATLAITLLVAWGRRSKSLHQRM